MVDRQSSGFQSATEYGVARIDKVYQTPMKTRTQDSPAIYHTNHAETGRQLRFDRGTLLLEGVAELPVGLESWFQYDPRVEAYRAPAYRYNEIIGPLKGELARNKAPRYQRREMICALEMMPYPHQQEALAAWKAAKGRGVVVLPTGAGKTLVGLLALGWAQRDALIMVPTLDLMQQWYALLRAAFPDQDIGLIGGWLPRTTTIDYRDLRFRRPACGTIRRPLRSADL